MTAKQKNIDDCHYWNYHLPKGQVTGWGVCEFPHSGDQIKCNYGYSDVQNVNVTSDSEITISYDTVTSSDDIDNEDD